MDPRRFVRGRTYPVSAAAVAWALLLLLLPPIACSGAVSPGTEEIELSQGDLIARLPAGVTTVGYIDFAAVRSSPVYEFFKREGGALADPERFEKLVAETGIDPRTDLHRLAFVQRGAVIDTDLESAGLVVVATFDRGRVEQALGKNDSEEYAGYTLYTLANWSREEPSLAHDDAPDGRAQESDKEEAESDAEDVSKSDAEGSSESIHRGFVTILDDSTLAFGSGDTIRQIVDVAEGAPSARTNERLMGLLEDVDAGSQVWIVSAQDALFSQFKAPAGTPMPQIPIDKINALIVSIRLHDGLALTFRGRTSREEDAELLGDSLNGMLALGKMMLQSRSPEIFEILDRAISAGSSGRDVDVRADLSMADLEALRDYAKAMINTEKDGKQAG